MNSSTYIRKKDFMKRKKWLHHIIGAVFLGVFIVLGLGCTTAPTPPLRPFIGADPELLSDLTLVPWSNYTSIPDKDFVVVGAIVVRDVKPQTVYADLIERAIEIGGHDIINVRVGRRVVLIPGYAPEYIVTATAVVIRFTDETIEVDPMAIYTDAYAVGTEAIRVPLSHHVLIPSKNYAVVGTIVVRDTNIWGVHADLIERAIEMGGHDVINVRVINLEDNTLVTATAVVIRYTDETIVVGQTMWY